ncbi:MAG: hypothetical protein LBP80_10345 [Treponema sp.]|jgi:hypothetical protein|nr:hypothetical protein [Treponema sp.]
MTRLELSPDGYERIMNKIQDIEDALNKGFFEPDTAARHLRTASGELYELRHTLHEVCLLVPDTAGPVGPGAA